MVNLILASHGDLSKGILNSTMMITGDLHKNVETFSLYPGENPLDYADELKNRIMRTKDTWIIIADSQGGSVHSTITAYCARQCNSFLGYEFKSCIRNYAR